MDHTLDWTDSNELTTVYTKSIKEYLCVEHPAIIENVDRALKTIGGTETVAKTYSENNKRLPLYWRPDDCFSKPAFAERFSATSMLFKVRRRRKKGDNSGESDQYIVELLGDIGTTYKYKGLADFQYLPIVRKDVSQSQQGKVVFSTQSGPESNQSESSSQSQQVNVVFSSESKQTGSDTPHYESILDKLRLDDLIDRTEYLSRDVPMYLPPMIFSRFDLPDKAYMYRPAVEHRKGYEDPDTHRPMNLIGTVRQKRTIFTVFVNYKDPTPMAASEHAKKHLDMKYRNLKEEEEVIKLFEERPVWSRIGLNSHFSGRKDKLKFILPRVAYYFLTGPWRCMWVKFGYDPRKDRKAKKYQTIDFRTRQFALGDTVGIKCKRGENTMAFPSSTRLQTNFAQIKKGHLDLKNLSSSKSSEPPEETETEDPQEYIYTSDKLPPCRQMYYQICDCLTDDIQNLVQKNDGKERSCDERDGWCMSGVVDKCRDVITLNTQQILEKEEDVGRLAAMIRRKKKQKRTRKEPKSDSDDEMDMSGILEDDMNVMETEILDCP